MRKTELGPEAPVLGLHPSILTPATMAMEAIQPIMASILVAATAEEAMVVAVETEDLPSTCLLRLIARVHVASAASPNKSLLRSGGRWYLVCKSLAVIDKLPLISLGEPPAAELSRWATGERSRQ